MSVDESDAGNTVLKYILENYQHRNVHWVLESGWRECVELKEKNIQDMFLTNNIGGIRNVKLREMFCEFSTKNGKTKA